MSNFRPKQQNPLFGVTCMHAYFWSVFNIYLNNLAHKTVFIKPFTEKHLHYLYKKQKERKRLLLFNLSMLFFVHQRPISNIILEIRQKDYFSLKNSLKIKHFSQKNTSDFFKYHRPFYLSLTNKFANVFDFA